MRTSNRSRAAAVVCARSAAAAALALAMAISVTSCGGGQGILEARKAREAELQRLAAPLGPEVATQAGPLLRLVQDFYHRLISGVH